MATHLQVHSMNGHPSPSLLHEWPPLSLKNSFQVGSIVGWKPPSLTLSSFHACVCFCLLACVLLELFPGMCCCLWGWLVTGTLACWPAFSSVYWLSLAWLDASMPCPSATVPLLEQGLGSLTMTSSSVPRDRFG